MNTTLASIAAATFILGSLVTLQARDTITRQEFEQAAHQLEKGVEQGKISKQAARAGIEGLRKAMGEEARRDRKPAGREDLEHIGREIRKAVAEGKITEEEGRKKMEAIRRKMAADGERDQPKRDAERNPREIYARAEAELKAAVKSGRITEEQARERLDGLRKRLSGDREHADRERGDRPHGDREHGDLEHGDRENAAREIREGIGERLKQVGARLKEAVANGDMTADEAWAKWHEVKKEHVAPRLEAAVKEGKLSEQDAKAIWHEIERAEVGEKLKAAVAAGELSEEDARARWEAFEKKHDR